MARSSDTIGNVVSILVVALVGYLAIVYLKKVINQSKSIATINSAKGSPLGSSVPGGSPLGAALANLFGGKINDGPALNDLFQQYDQTSTNNLVDALANVQIPELPLQSLDMNNPTWWNPIDYTNGGGGGGGSSTDSGYLLDTINTDPGTAWIGS